MERTTHTPKCLEIAELMRRERERWVSKWPNFCRACDAYGGKRDYSHEEGATFWECPHCIEEGKCPRCGVRVGEDFDFEQPCPHCCWELYSEDPDDFAPPASLDGPCHCEEERMAEESSRLARDLPAPAITVYCATCREHFNEQKVGFIDLSEDLQGADRMTFLCPGCKSEQTSARLGR